MNEESNMADFEELQATFVEALEHQLEIDEIAKHVRWCKRDGEHYPTASRTVAKKVVGEIDPDFEWPESLNFFDRPKWVGRVTKAVNERLKAHPKVEQTQMGNGRKYGWKWVSGEERHERERLAAEADDLYETIAASAEEARDRLEDMGGEIEKLPERRQVNVRFGKTCYWASAGVRDAVGGERVMTTCRTSGGRTIKPTPRPEAFGEAVAATEEYDRKIRELT